MVKRKSVHALQWVAEPLEAVADYRDKPMFGCRACYAHGRLMLVLSDGEEPWNGLLVPVEREVHGTLMAQFPALRPHSVLGKWLYLPMNTEGFEETALELARLMAEDDPRFGVVPQPKSGRKKAVKKGAKKGVK